MNRVGIHDLRQNLSRYVDRVKQGEGFVVTERGTEVARLVPSGERHSAVAFLVGELGASPPEGHLLERLPSLPPAEGPPSEEVLGAQRAERT